MTTAPLTTLPWCTAPPQPANAAGGGLNPAARRALTCGHLLRAARSWLVLLCLLVLAHGAQANHQGDLSRLHARSTVASLQVELSHMADPQGRLTLAEVQAAEARGSFKALRAPLRTSGDATAHWLRLRLLQDGPRGDWVLSTSSTGITEVQFFGPFDAQGRPLAESVHTGLVKPWRSRPLSNERYAFRVQLDGPGETVAWIRLRSTTPQPLSLAAFDLPEHTASRQDKRLFDGLTYGILLALLVYNLVLAAALRDTTHLLYVAVCGSALLTLSAFNGHFARYVVPDWPGAIESTYQIFPALWIASAAFFGRRFLSLDAAGHLVARLTLLPVLVAAAAGVLALTGDLGLAQRLNELNATTGLAALCLLAGWRLHQGYRPAAWYVGAQLWILGCVGSVVLVNWGLLHSPFMLANGLQIGIAGELAVFGIALHSRFKLLEERQAHLQREAERLAEMAQTDPLTGLANRSGLSARAEPLLAGPGPHALLMLDLDHFKPVNDLLGHQAGDEVLITVAQRLAGAVREGDLVARMGGDEFALLLRGAGGAGGGVGGGGAGSGGGGEAGGAGSAQSLGAGLWDHPEEGSANDAVLQDLCKRIQAAVCEPLRVSGGQQVQVGCSIGVAQCPADGSTLDALLRAADVAMYRAKDAGRGQLSFYMPQGPNHLVSKVYTPSQPSGGGLAR